MKIVSMISFVLNLDIVYIPSAGKKMLALYSDVSLL
jgi:hypothetical protein